MTDVRRSQVARDLPSGSLNGRRIGQIDDIASRLAALGGELGRNLLNSRRARQQSRASTGARQGLGSGPADTSGGAGDNDCSTADIHPQTKLSCQDWQTPA